jgi:hypothetical protein
VGHPRHEPESFADLVHKVRSTAKAERTDARPWPQPISDGYWIDDSGIHWHIRGGRAGRSRPALRRLLRHSDLRVLHAYGLHPIEVVGAERAALLERVERWLYRYSARDGDEVAVGDAARVVVTRSIAKYVLVNLAARRANVEIEIWYSGTPRTPRPDARWWLRWPGMP